MLFNADIVGNAAGYDLGSATYEFADLYLNDTGTIYFGAGQDVTLAREAAGEITIDNPVTGADAFSTLYIRGNYWENPANVEQEFSFALETYGGTPRFVLKVDDGGGGGFFDITWMEKYEVTWFLSLTNRMYMTSTGIQVDDITTGSGASSPSIALRGNFYDGSDHEIEGNIQLITNSDPYLLFSVDDDGATPTPVNVMRVYDTNVSPHTDSAIDLGLTGTRWATAYIDDIVFTTSITGGGTGHDQFSDMVGNEHINHTNVTITAGTGLAYSSGGTDISASATMIVDLSELTDMTAAVVGSEDELILLDNGADRRKLVSEITLSDFNNDSNWSATTGTVTSVAIGDGLTGTTPITSTGTITLGDGGTVTQGSTNAVTASSHTHAWTHTSSSNWDTAYSNRVDTWGVGLAFSTNTASVDLSELTDMTDAVDGSQDEMILLDNGADRRKLLSEIALSAFNDDLTHYTNTDVDSHLSGGVGIGYSTGAITVDLSELTDMTEDVVGAEDELILLDSGADRRKLLSEITLSAFNDDLTHYTNSDVDSHLSGGVGITYTTGAIAVDLSELTDMTEDAVGTEDEMILLDSGADRRKLLSEISLSAFNDDLGAGGTVVSVGAGNGMNFTTITATGTVTMGTPSDVTQASTSAASGTTHSHAWSHTSSGDWDSAYSHIHNLTTDIDHNDLTNTHNLSTDIDHDGLTNTHNMTTDIDSRLSGGTGITYTTGTIATDLSELTDMTDAVVGSEDELILLDNGVQRRKLVSEITLSDFSNDSSWSATVGTVTSVAIGDGLTGTTPITSTGTVTLGDGGTVTQGSTNAVTASSHTHAWTHTSSGGWDSAASASHAQSHVLSGGDHTASGLTTGYVIRASGTTTFAWAELQYSDLGGTPSSMTPDAHVLATTGPHTGTLPLADLASGTQGGLIRRGGADWEEYALGTETYVLKAGASDVTWSTVDWSELTGSQPAPVSHAYDSHSGTVPFADLAAGTQGGIIRRGGSDWEEYALGTETYVLKAGATDVAWGQVDYSELAGTQPAPVAHVLATTGPHTGTLPVSDMLFNADIIPNATGFDLGSATYELTNIYASGYLYLYDDQYEWLYSDGTNVIVGVNNGNRYIFAETYVRPSADGSIALGDDSYYWSTTKTDEVETALITIEDTSKVEQFQIVYDADAEALVFNFVG